MLFFKKQEARSLGQMGEDLAVKYLEDKGYKILDRNFCNTKGRRMGEIDIIAQKEKEIVFVEVKTRELLVYDETLPEENINRKKLHKMAKIANFYIQKRDLWKNPYRFDAVSVWLNVPLKKAKIKHLESIFF